MRASKVSKERITRCATCGARLADVAPSGGRPRLTCSRRCSYRHSKRVRTARRCEAIAAALAAAGDVERAQMFTARANRFRRGLWADSLSEPARSADACAGSRTVKRQTGDSRG
jgi:recombinational DNA repair protein (RecF pathway)